MKKEKITISDSGAVVVPESVSMRAFEIADLFGVYVQTVNVNIKAIIKSGVISPDTSGQLIVNSSSVIPIDFGLEMIVALAFRIKSHNAKVFREWLIRKAVKRDVATTIVLTTRNSNIFN